MGYKLCIAEKPSVARDIAHVLGAKQSRNGYIEGSGYLVTWAIGHLVGLAEPSAYGYVDKTLMWTEQREKAYAEIPLLPSKFMLTVLDGTKQQFEVVKSLIHRPDVDEIIDCGDMGPEGHVLQDMIRNKAGCNKPVKRFCATSLTEESIRNAMNNLQPISKFNKIIESTYCKKKADWILGLSISRAMSLKHNAGIRVGRVQSPTLYFIVFRYLQVESFKPVDYYTLKTELHEGFSVYWKKDTQGKLDTSVKDAEGRITDKPSAALISDRINKDGIGSISKLEVQKRATDRPQLYDITELQRDANRKYGYSAALTLAAAQALYETHKVLSYPRTDSRYITSDLEPYLNERLRSIGTIEKYYATTTALLEDGLNIDKIIVDDSKVTDHHAIIPTEKINGFCYSALAHVTASEKKAGVTTEVLKNILDLVLTRTCVSLSKPYVYEYAAVEVAFPNGYIFKASGTKPISMGWKGVLDTLFGKIAVEENDNPETDEEQIFPTLREGQHVNVLCCSVESKKTTPPKLHTEATLLTAMEKAGDSLGSEGTVLKGKGIGTQATRAEVIKTLIDTAVVYELKKGKTAYLIPTKKGLDIIRALPEELRSPMLTAAWEKQFEEICDGKITAKAFMEEFEAFMRRMVDAVKQNSTVLNFKDTKEVYGACPWCQEDVYRSKKSSGGKYYIALTRTAVGV
jgi:DNA topoisomerase-3